MEIILDSVMGPGLADLAGALKFNRRIVAVGSLDPRPAPVPMNLLTWIRYASFEHTLDSVALRRIASFLRAGRRNGGLRPAIDRIFELDDIAAAHTYLESGQQVGKIVVTL